MNQSFLSGLEGMAGTTRLELATPGRVARTINLDTTLVALPSVLEGGLLILLFLARLASAEPFTPPPIQPPKSDSLESSSSSGTIAFQFEDDHAIHFFRLRLRHLQHESSLHHAELDAAASSQPPPAPGNEPSPPCSCDVHQSD